MSAEPPPIAVRHSRRIITEPDGFGDAVSGTSLAVDFQRRQVRPAEVEQFQTPGWALDFGEVHAKTRVRGVLLGGWASLCLVRGPGGSIWNGQSSEPGCIALTPPGEELDGCTDTGFSWLTVAVPPAVWAQCRAVAGIKDDGVSRFAKVPLPAPLFARIENHLRAMQRRLRSGMAEPHDAFAALDEASRFAAHCFTTACELSARLSPPRDSLRNRARLARRADAWMREHLAESIHMSDVCLALGVSRRELEYAFRSVFDESPRDYLQMLRLNAIRRTLRGRGGRVIHAAFDHGMTHLGRFAAQYQALFGERPHATRVAQRSA